MTIAVIFYRVYKYIYTVVFQFVYAGLENYNFKIRPDDHMVCVNFSLALFFISSFLCFSKCYLKLDWIFTPIFEAGTTRGGPIR